jgi:hypothetical protein
MSVIQPFLSSALINHIFRASAYTMPTHLGVALFVGAVEVTGGAYARQDTIGSTKWSAPVSGLTQNSLAIIYPTATAAWGVVDHYGIYDQVTAGNLLIFDALTVSRTINIGDIFEFAPGQLQIQWN